MNTPITVTQKTSSGGTVNAGTTTVQELAEGAIQVLPGSAPTASAPTTGLPSDARPGRFYQFASQPGTLYCIGPDGVWRALVLVRVA